MLKGLQQPLEFMGIQGRYIYWAAAAVGGAIVGFIIAYCIAGFVAGLLVLLDQSKFRERFDEIKSILGLTDVDCRKIFTIKRLDNKDGRSFFREVFIRRGSTSGVYGVEEPRECYMTYTTERAEKEALKLYKSRLGCSHEQAIARYCADWEASGLTNALPFAQKVNQSGKVLSLDGKAGGKNDTDNDNGSDNYNDNQD